MAFDKPAYPDDLKRANWDKNKSVLAKMKGYTGMGESLQALEAQYKKVKWDEVFELSAKFGKFNEYAANGFSIKNLDAAVKAATAEVTGGECSKVRTAAQDTRKLGNETAKDYDKNPLLKKSAQLCRNIATAADQLSVAVNINSMSSKIEAERKRVMVPVDLTLNVLNKDYKRLLVELDHAIVPVVQDPSYTSWNDAHMMDHCRNLNQVIGNAGKMAAFGCDIGGDGAAFKTFFDDMNLYARVQVPFKEDASPEEIKKHLNALLQLRKRAQALRA